MRIQVEEPDQIITTKELAEWLSLSERTLANWRSQGKGPKFIRVGCGRGSIRYRKTDVIDFIGEV